MLSGRLEGDETKVTYDVFSRRSILVEGDIVVRHPLAEYLRECGFTVFEASNGDEAKRALTTPSLQIDVVLPPT